MSNKRILITGASTGIGQATTELFLADGDEVISLDIKDAPAGVTEHVPCDLSDPGAIDAALNTLKGNFDVLLNIAGVPGTVPSELIMRVNTLGLKKFTEGVFDRLNDKASIVNIASIAGAKWMKHLKEISELLEIDDFNSGVEWCNAQEMDGNLAYHFSKECVVVYSKQLAGRGIKRGIRVNSVSPGPVATPLLPDFKEQAGAGQLDWVIDCVGRAAQPKDIANVVKFLASDAAAYINGEDIVADHGFGAGLTTGWIDKHESPLLKARQ